MSTELSPAALADLDRLLTDHEENVYRCGFAVGANDRMGARIHGEMKTASRAALLATVAAARAREAAAREQAIKDCARACREMGEASGHECAEILDCWTETPRRAEGD